MGHQSPTMITVETSFPPNGSSKSHHGYRRKEFPLKKGHQPPTIVTEERSFPAKGTLKAFNGYRRKEFSAQRVTNRHQWLPKKGVFRPKGHQSPTMVTEKRSFPPKGSPTAHNGYRGKEFSRKRVTKVPQ
jgi:hypothetical protein